MKTSTLILGSEEPKGFVIFASCDNEYAKLHAPSFIHSVAKAGNNPHVHIIDPELDGLEALLNVKNFVKTKYDIDATISAEYSHIKSKYSPEPARVYYACNRFLVAPKLMESYGGITSLMVSDIDSLFMRHIDEPGYGLGLFLREPLPETVGWEQEGTRVAAGIFYFNRDPRNMGFAETVAKVIWSNINEGNMRWFLDQVALSYTFEQFKTLVGGVGYVDSDFHCFTPDEMDWEFKEGTMIWTGKGPRKYDNPTYVAKKREFERLE